MIVGVTGDHGFLGRHVRARLLARDVDEIRVADRATWTSAESLDRWMAGCGLIVHAAGVSGHIPENLYADNVRLAEDLAAAKRRTGSRFRLAYANSVRSTDDTAYGESKRAASATLAGAQGEVGDSYLDVLLPHLFGEGGRPHHNSAVATFAHQLATGDKPRVIDDIELELLHAQDAAMDLLDGEAGGEASVRRPVGQRILVSEVLARLQQLALPYLADGWLPALEDRFDLRLFNMFRWQLFPRHCPRCLVTHRDRRATFSQTARSFSESQVSVSTTRPGGARGNHFHFDRVERFVVISGEARIGVRALFEDRTHEFDVSGDRPAAVDIPTLHAHNIVNTGRTELVTLFGSNDHFDPDKQDATPSAVLDGGPQ